VIRTARTGADPAVDTIHYEVVDQGPGADGSPEPIAKAEKIVERRGGFLTASHVASRGVDVAGRLLRGEAGQWVAVAWGTVAGSMLKTGVGGSSTLPVPTGDRKDARRRPAATWGPPPTGGPWRCARFRDPTDWRRLPAVRPTASVLRVAGLQFPGGWRLWRPSGGRQVGWNPFYGPAQATGRLGQRLHRGETYTLDGQNGARDLENRACR